MPPALRLFIALLLPTLLSCGTAAAGQLQGVVTHVTDGDSLWIRPSDGGAPVQVRIHGIDAPEICQAFGKQARRALAARVLRRQVQASTRARDVYERTIARVSVRGQDVGAALVAGGHAWSSRYRGQPGPYAAQEAQARKHLKGLWAEPAIEPRLFRKRHGSCRPALP
jgi:endonuclease YncB( thermonuclease family)